VAYLDDDARASLDWCERILKAFQTVSPPPVAVGGEIHPFYEMVPPAWFTDEFEIRTWGTTAGFLEPPRARYGFSGSNMAFRKTILKEFGGFCEEYGMEGHTARMGEDAEFFSRVYDKQPWFWYDPAILVHHWAPAKIMKISSRFCRAFRSGEAIARMQKRRLSLSTVLTGSAEIILLIVKIPFSLTKASGGFKTQVVKKVQDIGFILGSLYGANPRHS